MSEYVPVPCNESAADVQNVYNFVIQVIPSTSVLWNQSVLPLLPFKHCLAFQRDGGEWVFESWVKTVTYWKVTKRKKERERKKKHLKSDFPLNVSYSFFESTPPLNALTDFTPTQACSFAGGNPWTPALWGCWNHNCLMMKFTGSIL